MGGVALDGGGRVAGRGIEVGRPGEAPHLLDLVGQEGHRLLAEEFEPVELDRIVAGRNDDAAVQPPVVQRVIQQRAGRQADRRDLETGRAEAFDRGRVEAGGTGTAVARDDDGLRLKATAQKGAVRLGDPL